MARFNSSILGPIQTVNSTTATGIFTLNNILAQMPFNWPMYIGSWTDPDLAIASYDSVSYTITEVSNLHGIAFKPDGTKLFIVANQNDKVYEYSLSTAWDLSTVTFTTDFSTATQEAAPCAFFFRPDGTKMYVFGQSQEDVFQYALSTAWDLSTASYESKKVAITQADNGTGLYFKSDGTSLYACCKTNDRVYQYDMTTAWDVSTASYASKSISVASQETNPEEIFFNPSGDRMYLVGTTSDSVHQYSLSTAWDLSTASYDSISFSHSSQADNVRGITFRTDGSKMYLIDLVNDKIFQYST